MKTYKVTRIYLVPAESKAEALRRVHATDATVYLNVEFAKEADAPDEPTAWGNAVKQQVYGGKK
jgi:hypothetical protein